MVFKASGKILKTTRQNIYIAFYDSETDSEEIAVYSNPDPSQGCIPSQIGGGLENSAVWFDAYQLDPCYPIFSDGLFVSWMVMKAEYKISNNEENFLSPEKDPFDIPGSDGKYWLEEFEIVPTFFNGTMEFYGYFKSQEDAFTRFKQNLRVCIRMFLINK